jgi:hypothetical protein
MPGESLILINPRRRKRRRNPSRRSRRMPAGLRRYWAGKRGTRLANPRRRRRRRNPIVHGYRRRRPLARRRNPRRSYRMRRRSFRRLRNPRGDFMSTITAGVIGAGGALLLNVVYGYVNPYLPASLQTGLVQTAVLGVGALGLGYLVGKFVSQDIGNDVAFGGLSVVLYNAASTIAQSSGLSITNNLSGYADYTPRRLGAYMAAGSRPGTAGFRGLGYVSPAPVLRRPALGAYMRSAPMNVAPQLGNWGDGM